MTARTSEVDEEAPPEVREFQKELAGLEGTLEKLSEEEAYLAAILADTSGIDQAELLWYEPTNADGCFRARPYQWAWWRSEDTFQVDLSARTVGKSLSISLRGFAHIFCNPGFEMCVTAPEKIHLDPVMDLIEQRLLSTRLSREMLPRGRGAMKHQPFMCTALNGARIMGRIPQRDGRGMKGIHPLWLEVDESQDFPEKGYKEVIETLRRGVDGAIWRCHGVTNGVGGWFYDITQGGINTAPLRETAKKTDEDWTVHRMVAMVREDWTDEERNEKIQKYGGSREAPDYLRNVLGQHGPASNVIFILHRLMKCVDDNLTSDFNENEYFHATIRDGDLMREGVDILDFLDFPTILRTKYKKFWIGMDVGYVNDPTEILVFAEYTPSASELNVKDDQGEHKARPQDGMSRLKLVARVSLNRIQEPDQVEVMLHVIDWFRPQAFAMDKTGNGLPLYQNIMRRLEDANDELRTKRSQLALDCIKGYGFKEKIVVDFDQAIDLPEGLTIDEQVKEAGIKREVLEVSTDVLRTYVDTERLWLPWDRELLAQFSGQTYTYSRATRDAYGRRRLFSEGDFHCLDAARMAALGHKQFAIEALIGAKEPETEPVLDMVITHEMLDAWGR